MTSPSKISNQPMMPICNVFLNLEKNALIIHTMRIDALKNKDVKFGDPGHMPAALVPCHLEQIVNNALSNQFKAQFEQQMGYSCLVTIVPNQGQIDNPETLNKLQSCLERTFVNMQACTNAALNYINALKA